MGGINLIRVSLDRGEGRDFFEQGRQVFRLYAMTEIAARRKFGVGAKLAFSQAIKRPHINCQALLRNGYP